MIRKVDYTCGGCFTIIQRNCMPGNDRPSEQLRCPFCDAFQIFYRQDKVDHPLPWTQKPDETQVD